MQKRSLTVLAAFLALVVAPVYASVSATDDRNPLLDDPFRAARFTAQVFDDTHGLPQNSIQSITRDRSGYLWVGTQDGAAFYNGRKWHPLEMPHRRVSNYVNAVLASSDGSLYFGTDKGGISRLANDQWTVYDTASGLGSNTIHALVEIHDASGRALVAAATAHGVSVFDGASWRSLGDGTLDGMRVLSLLESVGPSGARRLWAATDRGLARFDRGSWRFFGRAEGLAGDHVYCLAPGRSERGEPSVLVGTDGGLARVDGEVVTRIELPVTSETLVVRSVLESANPDGSATLWIGTIHGGLLRLENGVWTVLSESAGIPAVEVSSLLETKSARGARTLWIGTNGGGLVRYAIDRWRSFDVRAGLPSASALSFGETADDAGRSSFWMGMRGGLVRFAAGAWQTVDLPPELRGPSVRCLLGSESSQGEVLWAGNSNGLGRYEDGRWRVWTAETGLPASEVLGLARAADGGVWVCTGKGLARLDGSIAETYTVDSGLPHERVQCVVETPAPAGGTVLWVGTDGGVARREAGTWTTLDTASGLVNDVVLTMHHDTEAGASRLWVGTFGGVSSRDLSTPGGAWQTLDDESDPALPNNTVYQIERGHDGRLYFTTNRGVARLERSAGRPSIYTFTAADGLPANECEIGAGFVDRRGRVWVGTVKGPAVLDPGAVETSTAAGLLAIERTLVGGTERTLGPDTALPYNENSLTFEFALLEFFRESETRYRTEIEGFDDGPTSWSGDTKREISNLPGGDYVFRVWARDHTGFVSGPVSVSFRIDPAPWLTWWAYSAYFGLALAGVFGVARLRTTALRRKNEMLESRIHSRTEELAEKVSELELSEKRALEASRAKSRFLANMSHELRTPLNAILGFVQLMERSPGRSTTDREHLTVIARSGEHLLALINDVLSLSKIEAGRVVLAERVFDLPEMISGIEEMFRYRLETKQLQFLCETDGELPRYVRGDEGKLRQVLVNLLGNALKFTETGGVALRTRCEGKLLSFEVEDTGPGIASDELERLFEAFVQTESGLKATEGTGLGLAISRSYVRLMGGEIDVESDLGSGTRFSIVLPLVVAEGPESREAQRDVVALVPEDGEVRVLVVDDKWENRKILVELLTPTGFSVREAADGAAAVEIWTEWAPQIVWMDIKMPGVDGYEATRRIRALEADGGDPERSRTVVIAVTASAFAHERDAILEAGCDDFVSKPYRGATIFEKMSEHLGLRYLYGRDKGSSEGEAARPEITTSRFASLPQQLVADLGKAIVQGDVERAYVAADAIGEVDAELAEELRALIRSYRFDDIQELVTRG